MSRSTLLTLCGWWARDDASYPSEGPSEFAALGTEVHEAIASTVRRLTLPALSGPAAAHHRAWFFSWWRPRQGQGWRAEIAYALNVVTGEARELELDGARRYPRLGAGWICGTADAVRLDGDTVEIVDWKTGRHPPHARGNGQLYSLALAAATVYRRTRARVSIVSVTSTGCVADAHELDAFDLGAWREDLARAHAHVPRADPEPGPHCDTLYCPARLGCTARARLSQITAKTTKPRRNTA
jgi:hypothetical protein